MHEALSSAMDADAAPSLSSVLPGTEGPGGEEAHRDTGEPPPRASEAPTMNHLPAAHV